MQSRQSPKEREGIFDTMIDSCLVMEFDMHKWISSLLHSLRLELKIWKMRPQCFEIFVKPMSWHLQASDTSISS